MAKLAELELTGEFNQGFTVNLIIYETDQPHGKREIGVSGKLPPSEVDQLYENWSKSYRDWLDIAYKNASFAFKKREIIANISLEKEQLKIEKDAILLTYQQAEKQLLDTFNNWLDSPEFLTIKTNLQTTLDKTQSNRILIKSDHLELKRLPWQKWNLLKTYPLTEIGLASPNFRIVDNNNYTKKNKVRILVILGKDANIQQEIKELENLGDYLEVKCVYPKQVKELDQPLWQESWDILLFNGHSNTKADITDAEIQLDLETKIPISLLRNHLKKAIDKGLKLAIFNSCDGLGIAYQLAEGGELHLPQVLVMRELLPMGIAPLFLKYFLEEFTQGHTLYQSVRQARNRLELLEKEYPASSWLPIICQNPTVSPPVWKEFYNIHRTKLKNILIASLAATALVLGIRETGLLETLELKAFDILLNARPVEKELDNRILIVEVTEVEAEGKNANPPYSISDLTLARLLERIKQGKPKVIGVDIFRDIPLGEGYQELVTEFQKNDIPVIGTCGVYDYANSPSIAPPPKLPIEQVGFADFLIDSDGVIRRQLLALDPKQVKHTQCLTDKSLGVLLALFHLNQQGLPVLKHDKLQINNTNFARLKPHSGAYRNVDTEGYQIIFNPRNSNQTSPRFSVTQVFNENLNDFIKDRIVLVGVTAESFGDYHTTSYNSSISGVELHAQMISQILSTVIDGKPLIKPLSRMGDLVWISIWGLTWGFIILKVKEVKWQIVAIALEFIAILIICYLSLWIGGFWLPLIPPLLILPITYSLVWISKKYEYF